VVRTDGAFLTFYFYFKRGNVNLIGFCRLQAMQKMQSAAGKGRGAGGMPTPAQIQAMQVSVYNDN